MLNGVCINDSWDAKQASDDLNLTIRLILDEIAEDVIKMPSQVVDQYDDDNEYISKKELTTYFQTIGVESNKLN
jgi:hypothetical protein